MISEESAKYSVKNLMQKPSRSALTILSIFVGITTIFIFISFGVGLYDYIAEFTSEGTADKITVLPAGSGAPGLDDTFALTDDDLKAIEQTSGVYETSALYIKTAEIRQKTHKKYTFLMGYDPKNNMLFEMSNIGLHKGRWLKQGDSNKVILGYNYQIPDRIFSKSYDLNDKIEIQGQDFRIIGFVESIGNPQDDSQIYTTDKIMEEVYGNDLKGYNMVVARVNVDKIGIISERVEKNLRNSRDVEEGKENFFVQSYTDLLETYTNVLNGIIGFIVLIALISVVVSAINTANTMITSVIERTKEIGIMKAVGAKNSEIFNVFLFESSVLGFVSGLVGVGAGFLITFTAGTVLKAIGWGFLRPHYSWPLYLSLIAFATITGAISGAIPAYKASRINPVEALRYE
jgi:putative ABC transport system permease protein